MKDSPTMVVNPKSDGKRILSICLASVIMSLNIKTFVNAGGLVPGGATGLSLLIQRSVALFFHASVPYTLINVLVNAIPVCIGFRFIGKKFTLFSLFDILLTSVLTDLIPAINLTTDVLLISIFGGIINGFAISLCLISGTSTGGTDFLAIYFSEKKGRDSFNMILLINVAILMTAGLLFGWDKALYSIIFQYASTQVIHYLYRSYQQGTMFIVTDKGPEVCAKITDLTNHSATILEGEGAYKHADRYLVYSVVARSETERVIDGVKSIDPKAFINVLRTDQLSGHFYHRPEE